MQLNFKPGHVAPGDFLVENSAMSKRGPYKKSAQKAAPPRWRRTFLAEWRDFRGLTQEELAAKANVSVGLISAIESQKSAYSAESLDSLARALGIERGMLLDVSPKGAESLWSTILRADPNQREQIARHAEVIAPAKKRQNR